MEEKNPYKPPLVWSIFSVFRACRLTRSVYHVIFRHWGRFDTQLTQGKNLGPKFRFNMGIWGVENNWKF